MLWLAEHVMIYNNIIIHRITMRALLRDEMSTKLRLEGLSVDEMWQLHEEIGRVLSARLTSEKRELEKRLAQLRREKELRFKGEDFLSQQEEGRTRRKYPQVLPKYRNPEQPLETWSGRGKQPRWLAAALAKGHAIEEFAIDRAEETTPRH